MPAGPVPPRTRILEGAMFENGGDGAMLGIYDRLDNFDNRKVFG